MGRPNSTWKYSNNGVFLIEMHTISIMWQIPCKCVNVRAQNVNKLYSNIIYILELDEIIYLEIIKESLRLWNWNVLYLRFVTWSRTNDSEYIFAKVVKQYTLYNIAYKYYHHHKVIIQFKVRI